MSNGKFYKIIVKSYTYLKIKIIIFFENITFFINNRTSLTFNENIIDNSSLLITEFLIKSIYEYFVNKIIHFTFHNVHYRPMLSCSRWERGLKIENPFNIFFSQLQIKYSRQIDDMLLRSSRDTRRNRKKMKADVPSTGTLLPLSLNSSPSKYITVAYRDAIVRLSRVLSFPRKKCVRLERLGELTFSSRSRLISSRSR